MRPSSRLPSSRPAAGWLLVTTIVAAGCMSVAPADATREPASSTAAPTRAAASPLVELTAWERALDDVDANGRFSKDGALRLFATAFGPIPGVDVVQDLRGIHDRTIAIQAVHSHWAALTPDQRSAVASALTVPPGAETVRIPPVAASARVTLAAAERRATTMVGPAGVLAAAAAPPVPFELKQAIIDAGKDFRARIAGSLGRDMIGDVDIHFVPQPGDDPTLFGQAWGQWDGGVYRGCDVWLFPYATAREPLIFLNTLAHELFHCFQFDGYRTQAAYSSAPYWVIEGQAEWVGNIVGGEDLSDISAWRKYLTMPEKPLVIRKYDAIGFYAHLAETGTDPWTIFQAMWAAGGDSFAAFRQANAETDVYLDSWASGVLREPALGAAWDTAGPGITDDKYVPPRLSIATGDRLSIEAAFWTNNADYVAVTAGLLHLEVDGHARLSDGSVDTPRLEDAWFCTKPGGCECPDGDPLPFPAPQLSGDIAIAASGGLDGTVGSASGHSLDELCEEPSPPPSDDPNRNEFCKRYRALLAWGLQHEGTDYELTQPWAAEIATRSRDMRPYAPAHLVAHVELYIRVYGRYATEPEPQNVPRVGPEAAGIAEAFLAMNEYCGITGPGDI